jgi:Asp-tRNA(Asn)/Glu-tRNA(Gln) amidotransferase A subunit family amidase
LSAADLTHDALARIEATEPALNAFVTVTADLALKQAAAADAGTAGGPLAGVPVAIKDLVDVAGVPTSMGSLVHQGRVAETDSPLVARIRAAGAVMVGKTTTSE